MKKTHSSHVIFIFLGLLLMLFVLIFGIQYFQSQYSFDSVDVLTQSQDYDDGKKLYNPFTTNIEDQPTLNPRYQWVGFQSETMSFRYPDIFSLKIHNSSHVQILPPTSSLSNVDCSRVDCEMLLISPAITINREENITDYEKEGLDMILNPEINRYGTSLLRANFENEAGGEMILHTVGEPYISVSYTYSDVPDGLHTFTELQEKYDKQLYFLSKAEQESLAQDILETVQLK